VVEARALEIGDWIGAGVGGRERQKKSERHVISVVVPRRECAGDRSELTQECRVWLRWRRPSAWRLAVSGAAWAVVASPERAAPG